MKTSRRLLAALLLAAPALLHAHPGHDGGHELTWDFHGHGLWDNPLTFLIAALVVPVAAALLLRVTRRPR